tara:strand:- start:2600 stop:3430 length:831 start_codon:yes stop_codon:yes gene_type:complete
MKMKIINILKKNRFSFALGKLVMIFYFNYVLDSFRYIRFLLVKNNIINNSKYKDIRIFRDIHKGERCFIVATGPSLRYEDLELIKDEYSFSVNSIVKILNKTDWRPTYYGIQDANVFKKINKDILSSKLENIFVGHRLYREFNLSKSYIPYFHYSCFHAKHGEIVPLSSGFSTDASEIVYDGYSVTYSMLQIAVYMGFDKIYLLGCDCNYDTNGKQHFVESGFFDKQAASVGERMIYAYTVAKKYADKKGVKIYNSTRGGMLEVFERINFDILFNK